MLVDISEEKFMHHWELLSVTPIYDSVLTLFVSLSTGKVTE